MMFDMKRTFDEVVEAHADPERAAQILENPFCIVIVLRRHAGVHGHGEVGAAAHATRYLRDLIVVDTPPPEAP